MHTDALLGFLSTLLQLQLTQCRPGHGGDGLEAAVATTLQTLNQLIRDHGPRLLPAVDHTTSHDDNGNRGSHVPPFILLALRLAEPPSSSSPSLRRGPAGFSAAISSYEVQLAAVDVMGSVATHKVSACG